MPYSRTDIENARREMQQQQPRRNDLRSIPPDAEYVGAGPLFVWNGEHWVDWNSWIMNAPIRPEEKGENDA